MFGSLVRTKLPTVVRRFAILSIACAGILAGAATTPAPASARTHCEIKHVTSVDAPVGNSDWAQATEYYRVLPPSQSTCHDINIGYQSLLDGGTVQCRNFRVQWYYSNLTPAGLPSKPKRVCWSYQVVYPNAPTGGLFGIQVSPPPGLDPTDPFQMNIVQFRLMY